jgi:Excalibur calcium-binding domain
MRGLGVLVLAAMAAALQLLAVPAGATTSDRPSAAMSTELIPPLWRNCTNYNKRYPHGVGRLLARDKVRAGSEPVRNFRRSNRIFAIAMSYNRGLDRDKDRIACEKH